MQSDKYLSQVLQGLDQTFPTLDGYQQRVNSWLPMLTQIAKAIGSEVPECCTIGVLPLDEINAVANKFSDDSYFVGINMGFVFFAESIANIASAYFPRLEEVGSSPVCDKWGTNQFTAMLLKEFGMKFKKETSVDPRTQEQKELGKILSDMAVFAIVAHECAHVMMRHHELIVNSTRQIPITNFDDIIYEIPLTHKLEVAADNTGLIITLKYADLVNQNLALAYWANDYVFSCMRFIMQFRNEVVFPAAGLLFKTDTSPSIFPLGKPGSQNTHPEVTLRREALRYFMRSIPGNYEGDSTVANIGLRMSEKSDAFIRKLWDTSKEAFWLALQTPLQK